MFAMATGHFSAIFAGSVFLFLCITAHQVSFFSLAIHWIVRRGYTARAGSTTDRRRVTWFGFQRLVPPDVCGRVGSFLSASVCCTAV